jgi:SAM-dependent methyltransferase
MDAMTSAHGYVFDNAWERGRARLATVEELLDPGSIRHLDALGVAPGWRCLEIGAGGGSIAQWLCARVGPSGAVTATDLDTRYLVALDEANLDVRRHDVVADALEADAFDLVHARLVLEHLPARDAALQKLIAALKPGGRLLIESLDYVSGVPVSALGAHEHERSQGVRLTEFGKAGLDAAYGRRLPAALRAGGLSGVGNEGRVWVMEGGTPGARWFKLSMEQVRERLTGEGKLTADEIDHMLELFDDPGWAALSPIVMAAWGTRS